MGKEEGEEWEKRREWRTDMEGRMKEGRSEVRRERGRREKREVGEKGEGGQENEMQNNINRL